VNLIKRRRNSRDGSEEIVTELLPLQARWSVFYNRRVRISSRAMHCPAKPAVRQNWKEAGQKLECQI